MGWTMTTHNLSYNSNCLILHAPKPPNPKASFIADAVSEVSCGVTCYKLLKVLLKIISSIINLHAVL